MASTMHLQWHSSIATDCAFAKVDISIGRHVEAQLSHSCYVLLQSKDNDAERFLGKVKERMDR